MDYKQFLWTVILPVIGILYFAGMKIRWHYLIKNETLPNRAKRIAIELHSNCRHYYGKRFFGLLNRSYAHHLAMVVSVAERFKDCMPPGMYDVIIAACWLHDTIEDTRLTYNDLKKEFGQQVADIVYACSNEKGKSRRERANAKYYDGILETVGADFVKLSDRIANFENCYNERSNMFGMYVKENVSFVDHFYIEGHEAILPMLRHLKRIAVKSKILVA